MENEKEYRNIYQIALDNAISDIDYKYHDFGEYIPKERLDEIKLLQELVDKAIAEILKTFDGFILLPQV